MVEGNLDEEIKILQDNAPRQGSETFVKPDDKAMQDFRQVVEHLFKGNLQEAADISRKYGYELVAYRDQGNGGSEVMLLKELAPLKRNWGMYVIRPAACGPGTETIVLEAPHILADGHTPQIALDAFRALHGCALLVAGAHRNANQDGSADAAHESQNIFQAVHLAIGEIGGESTLVLQFHGFAARKHPGYPTVVLGGSPVNDPRLNSILTGITGALSAQGITSGMCDESSYEALCGESNIQSKDLQNGLFVHLELDDIIRSAPDPLISSLVETLINN